MQKFGFFLKNHGGAYRWKSDGRYQRLAPAECEARLEPALQGFLLGELLTLAVVYVGLFFVLADKELAMTSPQKPTSTDRFANPSGKD
jgi:hypothetical protein